MDRDREHLLGVVLADDIVVEDLADLLRGRNLVARFRQRRLVLLADDVQAKLDALVTNEDGRPDNDATTFRRTGKTSFCVGNDKSAVVGLSIEVLIHRMARYAVSTARAQHVSCGQTLRSATSFERHPQPGGAVLHRLHLGVVFDLDTEALQMFAQNCLGAPLRQAALKFILAWARQRTRAGCRRCAGSRALRPWRG